MRVGLIVDQSISNYILGVIARNSEIKLETIFPFERIDNLLPYINQVVNQSCCEALIIAVPDIAKVYNIVSLLSDIIESNDKTKIVVVKPSVIGAKSNFINMNNFDYDKVIELPSSNIALNELSKRLHLIISPKAIAKQIYRTSNDNIEAYILGKMYLSILSNEGFEIVGCIHTNDGTVLDSWSNGRPWFSRMMEETYIPVDDNVIEVDYVCPLIRLWTENYFHFMLEVYDKIIIAEELGFTGKYMLYHRNDIEALILLLGIPYERIIWIERCDVGKIFKINNVFDIEGFIVRTKRSVTRVCNKCKDIAAALISSDHTQYPRMLYVPRMGSRKLLGIEEIINKFDFYTFIPENHSLEEEIKYFYNADIILCPHGAALANAVFMRKGAALVETCPCNWSEISMASLIIAKQNNLVYRQIVEPAKNNPDIPTGQFRDYHVNNCLLDYTIKELVDRIKVSEECDTTNYDANLAK